jgi:hypothetical protein
MPGVLKKNLNYSKGGPGYMFTRINEAKQTNSVDILFVGSSHAYRGFNTEIFGKHGYKTFNLGSSSQTPLQSEVLVEQYLDKLNPKIVVFEVYPYIFSGDGVESSIDIISNDKLSKLTFEMALKVNHTKTFNTLLYGLYRESFNRDRNFHEDVTNSDDVYIPGGFVERIETNSKDSLKQMLPNKGNPGIPADLKIIESREGEWTPNAKQINAFERILHLLKQKNIEVYLVQAPITKYFYSQIKSVKQIDSYLSSKGNYYNFNELIMLDDNLHFLDTDHLNTAGVKIFNEDLITRVLNNKK